MFFKLYKTRVILVLSLLCANHISASNASTVIFGEINADDREKVFKAVIQPSPDYKKINQTFPHLRFEFLPPTAFQILEFNCRDNPNVYARVWNLIDPSTMQKYSRAYEGSQVYGEFYSKDFFTLMEKITKLGRDSTELINYAKSQLPETQIDFKSTTPNTPQGVLTQELFDRIIALETQAFKEGKTLLWRWTNGLNIAGLFSPPHWIDSVLKLSGESFLEQPSLYEGGRNNAGLSYGVRLLDGLYNDSSTLPDPFQNYDSVDTPACTLSFLRTHQYQLKELVGMEQSKDSDLSKISSRREELSKRTLYCLSVPQEELKGLARYFYDPRHLNLFFMGLRAQGEFFHYVIFTKAKSLATADTHHWKWDLTTSTPYEETLEDRKHLIDTWFKWMASNLHIIYQNNEIVDQQTTLTHMAYEEFYNTKTPAVLARMN